MICSFLNCRKGMPRPGMTVYRRFQPRLFSYLARLSGRHEVAQDLSSEVWCRAAAKLHTLRPDSQLLPWLFTIARNLFFSYCRWRNRDEHYLNELGMIHCRSGLPPTPLETAIKSEQEALLEEALMQLPRITAKPSSWSASRGSPTSRRRRSPASAPTPSAKGSRAASSS